jgi:hypothetical protein
MYILIYPTNDVQYWENCSRRARGLPEQLEKAGVEEDEEDEGEDEDEEQ